MWGTPGCAAAASFTHFVVTLRDPVARAVSAFTFVSRPDFSAGAKSLMRFAGGEAMYAQLYDACFPHPGGPSAFAEALDEPGACGDVARRCVHEPECSHLSAGAAFYMKDSGVLKVCRHIRARSPALPSEQVTDTERRASTGDAPRGHAHLRGPHRAPGG